MKRIINVFITMMLVVSCSRINNIKIFGNKPRVDLPNIEEWQKIKKGMTYQEVTQKLGREKYKVLHNKVSIPEPDTIYLDLYNYGSVDYNSDLVFNQSYLIYFSNGKVYEIHSLIKDFTIKLSDQKLVIFQPTSNQKFNYAPIDIRWDTLNCQNLIIYEISAEWEQNKGEWFNRTYYSYLPYFPIKHVGANNGRVKVRGISKNEYSQWSDYVYFKYK